MFLVLGFAFGSRSLDEVKEDYMKIQFREKIYIADVLVGTATACWGKFTLKSVHRSLGRWRHFFLMETPALVLIRLSEVSMLTDENKTSQRQSLYRLCKY